jgi:drug/metabolite transporter (DMT)-like permease
VLFAVLAAFASAACFALGSAMQQRVAGAASADEETRRGFLARIVRRPSWLLGLVLSAVAFALHALALSQGDLALVQPVIVSGIVFAVLLRSGLERRLPPRRTLVWLVLTWVGLALFLGVHPDSADRALHQGRAVVFVLAGALGVAGAVLVSLRTDVERRRGALLGGAAGLLFGLVAGLVKVVLTQARSGWSGVFTSWPVWTLAVVGLCAVLLNQRAYQATRLSVTAPVLNVVQVLVAIAFGFVVLGETAGLSPATVVAQGIGLAVMIAGVIRLASSGPSDARAD